MAFHSKCIGIILAGGQSKRFGDHKAFAIRENKHFYQYSIEAVNSFTSKIYLVSHPEIKDKFTVENNVTVIQDSNNFQGYGPLAGIYTVMDREHAEWFIVLPIDCPYITNQTIEQLLSHIEDGYDAIVPIVSEKPQPLIAIYNFKIKTKLFHALSSNDLSMHRFLKELQVKFIDDFKEDQFININFQSDYQKFIRKTAKRT